ncbi:hypothetical protein OHT59_40425 [Streptomyces sp. NBC_00243]|uniref:hypothetical protein n=1 Tax=Streptomyces sp. NBC_00243 TaxID=2975688 RepID=UPI002DDBB173|nr:hypothetical protein [Streptomyces sp. NBC_00243]WRZ24341.1 hypothetical protein OHT59_40425 [Streptomyces sp. NBC_00243]
MSTTSAVANKASDTTALEQRIALIACGEDSRPGNTQACDRHRRQGHVLLTIAAEGAVDALAVAICGHKGQCQPCSAKALEIIRVYNEGTTREAVAFDLEGGLIDVSRIHALVNDASRFHRASLGCPPNREVVQAARWAHASGKVVLVMTGGDRRLEQLVATWLGRNGVPATLVLMRGRGDYRPGAVVKRERLRAAHRQFGSLTVWSADPSVTRLSEQEGIEVIPLPGYWGDTQ